MVDPTLIYVSAAIMFVVAGVFLFFVLKGNERSLPDGAFQWVASGMAVVLAAISVAMVVVTYRVDSGLMPVTSEGTPRVTSTEMNAPAEDFGFRFVHTDEEGRLMDYRGDVILLNFWATWCPPCLEELPALNRLQERYRDAGLTVLTISDERRDLLIDFENRIPLQTISAYLPGDTRIPQPFRRTLASRPTTYVIDRDGIIRDFFLGARTFATFEQVVMPYLFPASTSESDEAVSAADA